MTAILLDPELLGAFNNSVKPSSKAEKEEVSLL
jgi:hypothetical protein